MPNFSDAVGSAVRDGVCGILAVNANIQGWISRNTGLPFAEGPANVATGIRRALCDNPNPVPDIPSDIGNRGQCSDTSYRMDYTFRRFNDQGQLIEERSNDFNFIGPLRDLEFESAGLQFIGWEAPNNAPGFQEVTFLFDEGAGQSATKTIDDIVVTSGPDNCGETAPAQPAPIYVPVATPISITYNDNSNNPVTELGDFNLLVPVFLPGSIQIPVEINLPDVTLNGNLNIDGSIEFNFPPLQQPDDTITDEPIPPLPPGQEPEDPETERRIIGVHVFTTLPPNTNVTTIFQEDGPNIFAPRGGSVRFLIIGGGGSSWTEDIDIKGDREYIPCPAPQGAISVVANPLPGGTTSLIRVFATIPGYLIPE